MVRSVNAAFDPDFAHSGNILAQGRADVSVAGGLSGKDKISVRDIEGATIFPIFADLTDSGTVFDSFGAVPIEPTELHGGPNFVNLKAYKDNGIVWAFDAENKITGMVNKVNKLKEQGAERVIVTVLAMKEDSHLSNSMVASALLRTVNGLAKAGRVDKKALAEATAHIRGKSVKKGKGYAELADFPGFDDKDGFSEWVDAATFDTRAAISRELLSSTFKKFLYFTNISICIFSSNFLSSFYLC